MAVKPMTAQGQWVCFGPDRAFAYKIDTGRVIPFESTSTDWNLTMQLEEPQHLVVFTDSDSTGKRQQEASGDDEYEEPHQDDHHLAAGGQHEQERGVAHHLPCSC